MKRSLYPVGDPAAVAPRTGAWIETDPAGAGISCDMSPPARGRGLKPGLEG